MTNLKFKYLFTKEINFKENSYFCLLNYIVKLKFNNFDCLKVFVIFLYILNF